VILFHCPLPLFIKKQGRKTNVSQVLHKAPKRKKQGEKWGQDVVRSCNQAGKKKRRNSCGENRYERSVINEKIHHGESENTEKKNKQHRENRPGNHVFLKD